MKTDSTLTEAQPDSSKAAAVQPTTFDLSAKLTRPQITLLNSLLWCANGKMSSQEITERRQLWRILIMPVEQATGENFDQIVPQ